MSGKGVIKHNFLLKDYHYLLKLHIWKDINGIMIPLMYRLIIDKGLVRMNWKGEINVSIILYLEMLVQKFKNKHAKELYFVTVYLI